MNIWHDISTEELFFTHKTPFYTGSLSNMVESEGTNRMYGLSALLFTLIKNNQTLLCDELENSLHYDLFTHIIKTFLVNSDRSSIFFTIIWNIWFFMNLSTNSMSN